MGQSRVGQRKLYKIFIVVILIFARMLYAPSYFREYSSLFRLRFCWIDGTQIRCDLIGCGVVFWHLQVFFRDSVTELVEYYFYVICKKQPVFLLSYFRGEWGGVSEIGCALSWWRWSDSANKILEDR